MDDYEISRARAAGFLIKKFTPYHFQVRQKNSAEIVNIWPAAKKILKQWQPGPAKHYTDIVKAVTEELEPKAPGWMKKRALQLWFENTRVPSQEQQIAYDGVIKLRETFYEKKN